MSYSIISTKIFTKEFKRLASKHPSLKADFALLADDLETNPFQGTSLGKDCFKIRLAITSKGRGKSGGARIITCVKIIAKTVYLVGIYDKSQQATISDQEIKERIKSFSN